MTNKELIAAPAEVLVEELRRRKFTDDYKLGIRLIDRDKRTFLFAIDEQIKEEDNSWIDTRYVKAHVDIGGTWHITFAFFK